MTCKWPAKPAIFAPVLALALVAQAAHGADKASWLDPYRDPQDGSFDMSNALLNHKGVLPVPDIITEPAVGYGLGLGLLYFSAPSRTHADKAESANASSDAAAQDSAGDASRRTTPPNITGLGGFMTGTHSWGVGLLHFHTWDDDRIRYMGAVGKVNLHLNYYGPQGNANAYQLSGVAVVQQVLFRIANSPWYVGPRYTFFDSATRFGPLLPNSIQNFERDVRVGKGGIVVDYDTRDNMFYPSRGTYAEFEADFARGGFGSSNAFDMQTLKAYHWIELLPRWVLGLRMDTGFSQGDIPFFAQPYVSLRGVSDAKFQDRNQLTGEVELRWNITPRWALLGFGGAGKAYGNLHSFSEAPTAFGFGTGFRYLVARKLGLSMGIDVAHGPGQNAFYIQVGSAWR
ncbi:BamA/TamA family outer membrane protein [Paraburkholderia silviterrae]|uniref:Glyceraldehyde-3-phosphate dehydrogenase n=1 Tax=Paraburkholderia silviterrae TaxID=2528715 RepID=A0A4R5M1R1_9BURK|nr:BamA/TamA family outer membrane protein [Paraburkholderia silviterrae]TDG19014.1 glyceraldehyde-3-phosphate dehydrogenase [Paraburkholderia silviterrae]